MSKFIARYNHLLETNPLRTKVQTTFGIYFVGDLTCQLIFHHRAQKTREKKKDFEWDKLRSVRQGGLLATFQTPYQHWYLNNVAPLIKVPERLTQSAVMSRYGTIILRSCVHLSTQQPINLSVFFFLQGVLTSSSYSMDGRYESGVEKWREALIEKKGYKAAFFYWMAVMLTMYTFVPIRYQNLYNDAFGFSWAIFVSFLASE